VSFSRERNGCSMKTIGDSGYGVPGNRQQVLSLIL
jgi:hypothetical protein